MVYTFFDKKTSVCNTLDGAVKSKIVENKELARELKTKSTLTFYR